MVARLPPPPTSKSNAKNFFGVCQSFHFIATMIPPPLAPTMCVCCVCPLTIALTKDNEEGSLLALPGLFCLVYVCDKASQGDWRPHEPLSLHTEVAARKEEKEGGYSMFQRSHV